jgi:hypothetical protein
VTLTGQVLRPGIRELNSRQTHISDLIVAGNLTAPLHNPVAFWNSLLQSANLGSHRIPPRSVLVIDWMVTSSSLVGVRFGFRWIRGLFQARIPHEGTLPTARIRGRIPGHHDREGVAREQGRN